MQLILNTPNSNSSLSSYYHKAMNNAIELYIVTAYLTEWDSTLVLNRNCKHLRIIIGKDFGITRKKACNKLMKWLPSKRKAQFKVADNIDGFHPKAVFWKDNKCLYHAVIGSSNLTNAAFETNYEANIYSEIDEKEFKKAREWIEKIESDSVIVSKDWIDEYKEASNSHGKKAKHKSQSISVINMRLPYPRGMEIQISNRQERLRAFNKTKNDIIEIFRDCAEGRLTNDRFYDKINDIWSYENGNRLQGNGWERKGKSANFQELSNSLISIINSDSKNRDDVVVDEIDKLSEDHNPARGAFLSEMLCLLYPKLYPVMNDPVEKYLRAIKFKKPYGASEGVKYIDLATKLRYSLKQDPNHPARNLAELDTVIWLKYKK